MSLPVSVAGAQGGSDELIEQVLMTAGDAPSGYQEVEFREADLPKTKECKGFRRSEKQERKLPQGGVIFADPTSPSFASQEVVVLPTVKAAKQYARGYAKGNDCVLTVFSDAFPGAGFEGLAPRFEDLGDQSVAYSFRLDLEQGELQLFVDIVLVRAGKVVVGSNFQGVGEPLSDADAIIEKMLQRMAEAA